VDGDGDFDLVAGARFDDDGGPDRGAAWVLFMEGVAVLPVAEFSGTPTSGVLPLVVAFTDLSGGGTVTAWSWDFGDGGTSTATNPGHTYATAGSYDVSLTVTGPAGTTNETKTGYITVSEPPPVADFSGTPLSGVAPLGVSFSDLSSGGPVTSWAWTFGDGGTDTAQDPSHTYTVAGTYDVALTVTGPGGTDGETKIGYVVVAEPPPVADFSGTPTNGYSPLSVAFTDASSGLVSAWSWDFGDGGTSTAQDPAHTYGTPGDYTVSLTATGPGGADAETKVGYVDVLRPPRPAAVPSAGVLAPEEADFFGRPLSGSAPLTVDFHEMARGTWTRFNWTFGDGGTSTQKNPSHTYTVPGLYTVSLQVSRNQGAVSDTETKLGYILVTP
jgi:PKD repeat protein